VGESGTQSSVDCGMWGKVGHSQAWIGDTVKRGLQHVQIRNERVLMALRKGIEEEKKWGGAKGGRGEGK
jgi:hypothetical protein